MHMFLKKTSITLYIALPNVYLTIENFPKNKRHRCLPCVFFNCELIRYFRFYFESPFFGKFYTV